MDSIFSGRGGIVRQVAITTTLFLALTAVSGALPVLPAHAHTFDESSIEELARTSDIVVVGRVVATDVFPQGPNGLPGIHTRVTLEAEEFLVGSPRSHVVFWVHGGRLGNRLRVVSGQARFTNGERVAVLLSFTPDHVLFPTGMARGKWAANSGIAYENTALGHAERIPTAAFRERVLRARPR